MIDTHCHLTDPRLASQIDAVLQRARDAGVSGMINIGTQIPDARRAVDLCRSYPQLRCAIGIHPNHAHEVDDAGLAELESLQSDQSVVALGEMGLDYHYDFAPKPRQAEVFQFQLHLAAALGRVVVIHCREAIDDCLAIMAAFAQVRAVFHCFTGSPAEARRILDAGYLLGFTGAVTFKNAQALREAAALTPLDRLVVETDAPYLTPEPLRKQKTNEPALVMHVASVVAQVHGISRAELDQITTGNATRFFGLPLAAAKS